MRRDDVPAWVALVFAALALGRAFADSTPPPKTPPGQRVPKNHRAAAPLPCIAARPPGNADPKLSGCKRDAECVAGADGRCSIQGSRRGPINGCSYNACVTDQDCAPKARFCACGGGAAQGNYCLPGNCTVDADCGQGGFCSPSSGADRMGACFGITSRGYYCHTAGDTCVDDEDCAGPGDRKSCAWQPLIGHWGCVANFQCPVG